MLGITIVVCVCLFMITALILSSIESMAGNKKMYLDMLDSLDERLKRIEKRNSNENDTFIEVLDALNERIKVLEVEKQETQTSIQQEG